MGTLEKNIKTFSSFLYTLKIFDLVKMREKESLIEKILKFFRLTFLILLFSGTLFGKRNFVFKDSIVVFSQFIDRNCTVVCNILIFLEMIIQRNSHIIIFKSIAYVDNLIQKQLKMKINYKRDFYWNFVLFSWFLTAIFVFISRATKGKLEYYYFIIFVVSSGIVGVVEMFYVALIFHIIRRLFFFKFYFGDSEKIQKDQSMEIFNVLHHLILLLNDNFGKSVLLVMGEIINFRSNFYFVLFIFSETFLKNFNQNLCFDAHANVRGKFSRFIE